MPADASFLFQSRFLLALADRLGFPQSALYQRVAGAVSALTDEVKPTTVLEIGAFEASFSIRATRRFPGVRALAFEANPYVFEHFRDEVTAAGVDYRNLAIGPESGPLTIHVPRDFRGSSRAQVNQMASLATNLHTEEHEAVTVDGARLDDVVSLDDDERLVAWIDVEGALEQVLSGARETLSRASLVFVEVESTAMWEGQWLDVDVARWFGEIGLVPVMRDYQRPGQYNLVFVSPELAADPSVAGLAASLYTPVLEPLPALEPVPPAVPVSKVGRLQGVLQRTLQAQVTSLREQNLGLRAQNRRLRRRVRRLEKRVAELGG